jgi:hypothetical protein
MKNKHIKARVNKLLVEIHRGFLGDSEATDEEILSQTVPATSWTKFNMDKEQLVVGPFSYRWVSRRVKKDPSVTAYELLVSAGFGEVIDL